MTSKRAKQVLADILYPVAALAVVLAVWAAVSVAKDIPILIPQLDEIFASLGDVLSSSHSWRAIGLTAGRVAGSFALSFVFAAVLAAAGTFAKPLHRFLSPIVTVLQSAPTMAVILLAVAWLDNSEVPLLVGFLICFPLLYNTCRSAVESVDKDVLEMANLYGIRPVDKLTGIYIPAVTPVVLDGAYSAVSLSVKVVIAAEVLAQTVGSIGVEMQKESVMFEIANLLAWTIVAIVMSFVFEAVVGGLKKLWERRRKWTASK